MTQTYKVQVSMNQAHLVDSGFTWKQGDFGFNIEIEVLDFDTTGATPSLVFRKGDGAVEATTGISVSGNKFTYAIRGTELETPGPCICDLKLKNSTTQRISTASFKYFVLPDTEDGLNNQAHSYSDTIAQIVSGFDGDIDNLSTKLSANDSIDGVNFSEIRGKKTIPLKEKKYIKYSDGSFENSTSFRCSDLISTQKYDHINFSTLAGTTVAIVAYYNDAGEYMQSASHVGTSGAVVIDENIPEGAAYVAFCKYGTSDFYAEMTASGDNVTSVIDNKLNETMGNADKLYIDAEPIIGKYRNTSGELVTSSSYRSSELVSIGNHKVIFVTAKSANSGTPCVHFFDANQAFLSYALNGNDTVYEDEPVYVPTNAAYFTISTRLIGGYNYEKWTVKGLSNNSYDIAQKYNDASYGALKQGYYNNQTGEYVNQSGWLCTEKLTVEPNEKYHIITKISADVVAAVVEFDENNNKIGFYQKAVSAAETYDVYYTVPTGVHFIGVTTKDKYTFKFQKLGTFTEKSYTLPTYLKNVEYTSRTGYMNTSGVLQEVNGWLTTNLLPCVEGETLKVSCIVANAATPGLCFFDENQNFLSTALTNSGSSNLYYIEASITVPTLAKYYTVSSRNPGYKDEYFPMVIQQTAPYDNSPYKDSFWNGKKIVWFGTSIPAGGYPQMVGKLLNCTVINRAFGSSCMRAGDYRHIAEDDPNGWKGGTFNAVYLSMAATQAEKAAVFDNWNEWKTELTGAPETITDAIRNRANFTSYEGMLAQVVDGGSIGNADLYIFDHFHNDRRTDEGNGFFTVPEARSTNERMYAQGAFNFLVRYILEKNPLAKIIVSGHYESDRKTEVMEAQQLAAKRWGIPCIDLWNHMGLSQQTLYTTGEWVNRTWVPDYYTDPVLKHITQIRIADDLHPGDNNDNGAENQRFAEALACAINNIRVE